MSSNRLDNITGFQQIPTVDQELRRELHAYSFQSTQLIWLFLGLLEGLLGLRLLFVLFAADPANLFAILLYGFAGVFLLPVAGLMGTLATSGMGPASGILLAMLIYALLGVVMERVVWGVFCRPYSTVAVVPTSVLDQRPR